MNRGLEIVRRLFLTAMWFAVGAIAIISTYAGISEYTEDYWYLKIKNEEEAKRAYQQVDIWEKDSKYKSKTMTEGEALKELEILTNLENYENVKAKKRNQMWLSIGLSIICLLVGLGLHKLINWIMVYKQKSPTDNQ